MIPFKIYTVENDTILRNNLKKFQIVHVLRCLKIQNRNDIGDTRVFNATITKSMHQVLLGTLLGDSVARLRSYHVSHGINQYKYCYYIAEKLAPFVSTFIIDERRCQTGYKKVASFWTYSHKNFEQYFKRFYPRGNSKKFFTEGSIYDLESEGLAYWFMDDGKYGEYGFYLCIGDISLQEGLILINLLREKFNIEATFQSHDKSRGYHNIYIKSNSRNHFLNLIDPFIIPSMRYKINGEKQYKEDNVKVSDIIDCHYKLCKAASRHIRFKGDENIERKILNTIKLDSYKDIYINKVIENNKLRNERGAE